MKDSMLRTVRFIDFNVSDTASRLGDSLTQGGACELDRGHMRMAMSMIQNVTK